MRKRSLIQGVTLFLGILPIGSCVNSATRNTSVLQVCPLHKSRLVDGCATVHLEPLGTVPGSPDDAAGLALRARVDDWKRAKAEAEIRRFPCAFMEVGIGDAEPYPSSGMVHVIYCQACRESRSKWLALYPKPESEESNGAGTAGK